MEFSFPFPFPKIGLEFSTWIPVPEKWEWNLPFPVPVPEVQKSFPLMAGIERKLLNHFFYEQLLIFCFSSPKV